MTTDGLSPQHRTGGEGDRGRRARLEVRYAGFDDDFAGGRGVVGIACRAVDVEVTTGAAVVDVVGGAGAVVVVATTGAGGAVGGGDGAAVGASRGGGAGGAVAGGAGAGAGGAAGVIAAGAPRPSRKSCTT